MQIKNIRNLKLIFVERRVPGDLRTIEEQL